VSQELTWGIGLALLAVLLGTLEFLVPSAGLLGMATALSLAAAIFFAFSHSFFAGMVMLACIAIGLPLLVVTGIRVWPRTPLGRRILNLPPDDMTGNGMGADPRMEQLKGLLGTLATARSDLLPSGQIEVLGTRYDAVAMGMPIDRGETVEICSVDGGTIRVRKTARKLVNDEPSLPRRREQDAPGSMLSELDLEGLEEGSQDRI